ncbi:response regulator [bacterium]|jgi:twitching motility two-component system response regulator PilH|nr:response regulator [bacterium]
MTSIKKILIVDDSKTETYYLTEVLAGQGYAVSSAENSDQALERLKSDRPDLILMDVVMPGKNGFQLTRELHHHRDYGGIPIFICSGKDKESDKFWGLRQGARDYLTKPLNPALLLGKIKSLQAA